MDAEGMDAEGMNAEIDLLLTAVCDKSRGPESLVDNFFSFLFTRTDFFHKPAQAAHLIHASLSRVLPADLLRDFAPPADRRPTLASSPPTTPLAQTQTPTDAAGASKSTTGDAPSDFPCGDAPLFYDLLPPTNISLNGVDYGRYKWNQSLDTVELTVGLLMKISSKEVTVSTEKSRLSLTIQNNPLFQSEELFDDIISEDTCWYLPDGNAFELTMTKRAKGTWWPSLFRKSDHKLRDFQPQSVSIDELDPDSCQQVQKMLLKQKLESPVL